MAAHTFTLIPQLGAGRGRLVRVGNTVLYTAGDAAAATALIGWCRLVGDRPAADVMAELERLAGTSRDYGAFCAIVIADDLAWEVRPQVDLGPSDGVARRCRPDLVLVPVGRQTRRIAVFTDGFEHHAQPTETRARIEDDIAKRRSILAASDALPPNERHWVWSFTWTDIATALGDGNTAVDPLLRDV